MDEFDRAMTMLARVAGLFGERGRPFIEVLTDDDEKRSFPITDAEEVVVRAARKHLAFHGKKPIPVE